MLPRNYGGQYTGFNTTYSSHIYSVFKKSVSLGVGPPAGDPGLKTITWRLQNSYAYEAKVLSVTTSKLCVSNSLPPQAHIIVAYSNGSLTCFLKDSLKQVCTLEQVFSFPRIEYNVPSLYV
jgi:hypothetical protein